ncbi:MAG: RNA polymerase subunit sigma-24, partial [Roseibacillus sp.]|nr:RNA polymerase subunit sigma-24 [Roseibacillus sp.]
LEEHSVREISELTGWGASKVKVTAMRARRKLAEQLHRLETSHERKENDR